MNSGYFFSQAAATTCFAEGKAARRGAAPLPKAKGISGAQLPK